MNRNSIRALGVFPILFLASVNATEKKDPYLRDDDISMSVVEVDVQRGEHGFYVYTYDLTMPLANSGAVRSFILDISCSDVIEPEGFDPDDFPSDVLPSFSRDGRHVPVAIVAPWGQAGMFGIAEGNSVNWGIQGKPGTERTGLTLITPYSPGAREYKLRPNMRYREEEYDYSGLDHDEEVPWTDDFTVTGMTTGPACPGEEYPDNGIPDDGMPNDRFSGSLHWGQSRELNQLLTYSQPLRDQFHLEPGTREFEMIIHYDEAIDPRTFRVTPQRNQLRRLFNPTPGTRETVRIPLEPGKNRIELQVQTRFVLPGQGETPPQAVQGRGGVSMDQDVFVIRVPDDGPGKGRGNALSRSQDAPGQGRGSNSND